jgi:hypothetical protein
MNFKIKSTNKKESDLRKDYYDSSDSDILNMMFETKKEL